MGNLFFVMAGGAVGSGLRYLFGRVMLSLSGPGYPWGTLGVNLIGGLAMGLLMGTLARTGGSEPVRLLLGVGVLGGFTTFSAFSLDMVTMIERGQPALALGYVLLSVVGAAVALFAGLTITRGVAA
ncbi:MULTISPECIES: fluoride efflux transporter FluC [unclassified Sphingomonas]|uniref:fluoride efflux transporter FluC n=1 Tax=unclassified Sphingomonas TaxID=196159 RepID=UPI00070C5F04|nr:MULTISPECIES: CrcB family protein [unclassified Sphingomonas]KQT26399.1 camphor resistance protein CrcB [Sphingomonas sp. Leaf407]